MRGEGEGEKGVKGRWKFRFDPDTSRQKAKQAITSHTTQHSTAQHSTAQHNTAQHSTAQHNTAQHSTTQHSTAQRSTTQHSTAPVEDAEAPLLCEAIGHLRLHLHELLQRRTGEERRGEERTGEVGA